jgi:sec-independent protein translocase protein TatA
MQPKKSIREGAAVRPGVDDEPIFPPRQMPKIAKRAAILFVEERSEFLGKTTHASYIARPRAAMKCLATNGDRQMLGLMSLLAFFGNLGGPDLIILLLIILVLFGAKKLPELARGMGSAIKEFQKAKDEFTDELHSAGKAADPAKTADVRPPASTVPRIENQPELRPEDQVRQPNPDRTDRI